MTSTGTLLTPAGTLIVANFSQYDQSTLAHDGTQWWLEWGVVRPAAHRAHRRRGQRPRSRRRRAAADRHRRQHQLRPTPRARPPRVGGGVHLFWYDLRVALGYDANVFTLPISRRQRARAPSAASRPARATSARPTSRAGPGGQIGGDLRQRAGERRPRAGALPRRGRAAPDRRAHRGGGGRGHRPGRHRLERLGVPRRPGTTRLGIKSRRLDADGSFVDAAPVDVMPGFSPDVEALGEDFLIACARATTTYPQFIDTWMRIVDGPTGGFQNAATLIGGGYVNVGPRVREDGSRWIVTYHSHWSHDSMQPRTRSTTSCRPNGSFTPAANPATTSGGSGTPDVAFSGQKYLFVWRNNSLSNANNYIAGRLMNANGTFADAATSPSPRRRAGSCGRSSAGTARTSSSPGTTSATRAPSSTSARTSTARASARRARCSTLRAFPIYVGPQGDATAAILSRPDGVSFVASARFQTSSPFQILSHRGNDTRPGGDGGRAGHGRPWNAARFAAAETYPTRSTHRRPSTMPSRAPGAFDSRSTT